MNTKVYYIADVSNLDSIIKNNLLSNAKIIKKNINHQIIGINEIKNRRLNDLFLGTHKNLHVGECVPFYFCYRSVMLYFINVNNREGQRPIIHFQIDLEKLINWAEENNLRWAFTFSNAGSIQFEDTNDINRLSELDWDAINSREWLNNKHGKQAEFLIEEYMDFKLVEKIVVNNQDTLDKVSSILEKNYIEKPKEINTAWYY